MDNVNGWSRYWAWGGKYEKSTTTGNWILYIYDDIDVSFNEIECTLRDYYTNYMQGLENFGTEYEDGMKLGITTAMDARHGENSGFVDSITVTVACDDSSAAAFGAIDEDGNVELPFSTWNLNTYDFSDWFVLLFVLFTGCACCFGCGWAMHRRRVFKAMDEASISDFGHHPNQGPSTPIVAMDGNASPHIQITAQHVPDNSGYADAIMQQEQETNDEPEIEIGVSVNSNTHGIMAEDSE